MRTAAQARRELEELRKRTQIVCGVHAVGYALAAALAAVGQFVPGAILAGANLLAYLLFLRRRIGAYSEGAARENILCGLCAPLEEARYTGRSGLTAEQFQELGLLPMMERGRDLLVRAAFSGTGFGLELAGCEITLHYAAPGAGSKEQYRFLSGTLLTALASLLAYLIDGISVPIYGAVYVNTALFLAFALNYPDAMVNIYFIIPVKMKWLAALEGILYALSVVTAIAARMWGQALMPIVALLNLFVFFTPDFLRKADRVKAHTRPQAVQFRRAVKEQQRQKGYHHKCSVCGRTDTDYPDLQFRYCSKCAGYHCFCEDHIFNHTHFTE